MRTRTSKSANEPALAAADSILAALTAHFAQQFDAARDTPEGWEQLVYAGDIDTATDIVTLPEWVTKRDREELDETFAAAVLLAAELARDAGPVELAWLGVDERAAAWASRHAANLVSHVNATTRQAIRNAVSAAYSDPDIRTHDLAKIVKDIIGLTPRQADDLLRYARSLPADPLAATRIAARADIYRATRAEIIARTESVRAGNIGLKLYWDQMILEGRIDKKRAVRVWQVTPDDRLCTLCAVMAGARIPYDGTFTSPDLALNVETPPLHPRCRCTMALDYDFVFDLPRPPAVLLPIAVAVTTDNNG